MPLWKYNIHRVGRDSLDYRQQFLLRFSLSVLLTSVNKRLVLLILAVTEQVFVFL